MAMSLRLPHTLAERGRRYAAESGISLNGLLAVALREYLDARTRGREDARTAHGTAAASASAGASSGAASHGRSSTTAQVNSNSMLF